MTIIATDTLRFSNLVKYEAFPEQEHCRDAVTANETTAKVYAIGTVLGKVTATGKYKIAVQTAVDGSQTPAALVLDDATLAIATDGFVRVMNRGIAGVSKGALIIDASYSAATLLAAYASIEALGIKVLDTI